MLIDSHCHLNLSDQNIEQLVSFAEKQGIDAILNVSVDMDSFPDILATATTYENVFASVGVHPNTEEANPVTESALIEAAQHDKVIAIGETGLDYHYNQGDMDWQHERFRVHIRAAKACNKPLIIHCREAPADVIRILQEENAQTCGGVMHCFVEDMDTAQAAMDLGFYISFSGIVTFKNAKALQAVAKQVPQDRILVETDAPWLAPTPYRGKPNQPAYVLHVAKFLADLRGEDFETLAKATTNNFFRLFNAHGKNKQ
ncbi:TatD family hydrolase [Candidatus Venteria ishoeyi]|uniref:TatD family hydrolase n=1 Tax=Candidatus Venteria ishoeyi TaxID=1899563 RepID=UPI0025A570A9|nr:TatD family hydrolase [Candidatus Venteria ishoeyi]MDM8546376.1 TatD family hydrolase [Candidatus Venteria ishoeyi]